MNVGIRSCALDSHAQHITGTGKNYKHQQFTVSKSLICGLSIKQNLIQLQMQTQGGQKNLND